MKRAIAGILLSGALIVGCKHTIEQPPLVNEPDTTKNCDPDTVYFERDILPILTSNCAIPGCHDAGTGTDGVFMNNYTNAFNTGDVVPFDPGNSDMYEVLVETDPDKRMPYGMPPLPQDQIDLIKKWIQQGAQNLFCTDTTACDTSSVTFSGSVMPILQSNCAGCHSPGNTSGVVLTTHAGAATVAGNGRLLGAINHASGFTPMPQGTAKLPSCQIAKIRIWVNDGAPNN